MPTPSVRERILRHILDAFNDIDPVYLNECLNAYELSQPDVVAARIVEKLTVLNAGEYPRVPIPVPVSGTEGTDETESTGPGRAGGAGGAGGDGGAGADTGRTTGGTPMTSSLSSNTTTPTGPTNPSSAPPNPYSHSHSHSSPVNATDLNRGPLTAYPVLLAAGIGRDFKSVHARNSYLEMWVPGRAPAPARPSPKQGEDVKEWRELGPGGETAPQPTEMYVEDWRTGPQDDRNFTLVRQRGLFPSSTAKCLSEVFPDADIPFLRECILETPCNVVWTVGERLLPPIAPRPPRPAARPTTIPVRPAPTYPTRLHPTPLTPADLFRPASYQRSARHRLYNTYPRLAKSTIRAVLAECNNDYRTAHARCKAMDGRSWMPGFLAQWFRQRSGVGEVEDPGVVSDVQAMERDERADGVARDAEVAREVNRRQYEEEGQGVQCACCFGDSAWEDVVACPAAHVFCTRCVERQVHEGLFGQARLNGRALRCFSIEGCSEDLDDDAVARCVKPDVLEKYAAQCVEGVVRDAGLPYVKCPFCRYAEVDGEREDEEKKRWRWRGIMTLVGRAVGWAGAGPGPDPRLGAHAMGPPAAAHRPPPHAPHPLPAPALVHALLRPPDRNDRLWDLRASSTVWLAFFLAGPFAPLEISTLLLTMAIWTSLLGPRVVRAAVVALPVRLHAVVSRVLGFHRARPLRPARMMRCGNPQCGKRTCRECGGEWVGWHRCHEREEEGLRGFVEGRMTQALMRTCGLYERENDDQVRAEAAAQAVEEWLAAHPEVRDGERMGRAVIAGIFGAPQPRSISKNSNSERPPTRRGPSERSSVGFGERADDPIAVEEDDDDSSDPIAQYTVPPRQKLTDKMKTKNGQPPPKRAAPPLTPGINLQNACVGNKTLVGEPLTVSINERQVLIMYGTSKLEIEVENVRHLEVFREEPSMLMLTTKRRLENFVSHYAPDSADRICRKGQIILLASEKDAAQAFIIQIKDFSSWTGKLKEQVNNPNRLVKLKEELERVIRLSTPESYWDELLEREREPPRPAKKSSPFSNLWNRSTDPEYTTSLEPREESKHFIDQKTSPPKRKRRMYEDDEDIKSSSRLHWYCVVVFNPGALLEGADISRAIDISERSDDSESENTIPNKSEVAVINIDGSSDVEEENADDVAAVTDDDHESLPPFSTDFHNRVESVSNSGVMMNLDVEDESDFAEQPATIQEPQKSAVPGSSLANWSRSPDGWAETHASDDAHSVPSAELSSPRSSPDPLISHSSSSAKMKKSVKPAQPKGKTRQKSAGRIERFLQMELGENKRNAPYIVALDSLSTSRDSVLMTIQRYLEVEAQTKKQLSINSAKANRIIAKGMPLQANHWDCGVFLLMYIEKILGDPDTYLTLLLYSKAHPRSNSMELKRRWFDQKEVPEKRKEIIRIIEKMSKERQLEKASPIVVEL
ncbi:hypothetical protein HDU93_006739 [Gonapodya sp. JEL0774]|nr:hypothetical protein HDU93_006739 [Gonapodya sp. JEL0774]